MENTAICDVLTEREQAIAIAVSLQQSSTLIPQSFADVIVDIRERGTSDVSFRQPSTSPFARPGTVSRSRYVERHAPCMGVSCAMHKGDPILFFDPDLGLTGGEVAVALATAGASLNPASDSRFAAWLGAATARALNR